MIKIIFDRENKMAVAYDNDIQVGECVFIESNGAWNIIHTGVNEEWINPEKNSEFDEHETSTDVIGGLIEKRDVFEGEKVENFGFGSLGFNGKDMLDILEVWKKVV